MTIYTFHHLFQNRMMRYLKKLRFYIPMAVQAKILRRIREEVLCFRSMDFVTLRTADIISQMDIKL